ncbi:LOW QUALITY PROTEIN: hypothetical protein SETIT_9G133500v2 [Setaria italica]|uniref:Uncharacterized protein n=1 Tax=Setaria italica TaxID=4555 RepID=A0A368SG52_SETIT|nr:LOW QUALITY PROTEIN: hypothetical protein SETIT_9G133500v2 [Setaria italica]
MGGEGAQRRHVGARARERAARAREDGRRAYAGRRQAGAPATRPHRRSGRGGSHIGGPLALGLHALAAAAGSRRSPVARAPPLERAALHVAAHGRDHVHVRSEVAQVRLRLRTIASSGILGSRGIRCTRNWHCYGPAYD